MPASLQKHIRYPEDLFLIQARIYQAYHMEAINQNTEISQQLTLWNQMGSRVIRGANLLVIPIENSILYVSPTITKTNG